AGGVGSPGRRWEDRAGSQAAGGVGGSSPLGALPAARIDPLPARGGRQDQRDRGDPGRARGFGAGGAGGYHGRVALPAGGRPDDPEKRGHYLMVVKENH